jgi:hypothetical protein
LASWITCAVVRLWAPQKRSLSCPEQIHLQQSERHPMSDSKTKSDKSTIGR